MTKQYINGLMTVLAQEDGERPVFLDDWYFYRKAGLKKWVRNGFLNLTPNQNHPLLCQRSWCSA